MTSPSGKGRGFSLILIMIAFAGGWYWLRKPQELSERVRFDPQLSGDFDVLRHEGRDTPPERVALALLRLGGVRSPEGKREALRRQRDSRVEIRKAVAEALAITESDPEVVRAQQALLSDPDSGVRIAALRGLAFSTEPGHRQLLESRLADPKTGSLERLIAHAGLSRSGSSEQVRRHLSALRSGLESSIGTDDFTEALRIVVRLSPDDPGCIRILEKWFASGRVPPPVQPELYLFLVRRSPSFVLPRVMTDIRSPVLALRSAVINSLGALCPPDRWRAIEWVIEGGDSPEAQRMLAMQAAENLGVKWKPGMRLPPGIPKTDRCVSRR
jgi:hypothetical protein